MRRQRFFDRLDRAGALASLVAGSSTVVTLLASVDERLVLAVAAATAVAGFQRRHLHAGAAGAAAQRSRSSKQHRSGDERLAARRREIDARRAARVAEGGPDEE